ncbi:MAG: hypothetical protein GXY83_07235 [Rhodopirellula sp.]|nr:hypothetical protein [Rhodopirellula sp.]
MLRSALAKFSIVLALAFTLTDIQADDCNLVPNPGFERGGWAWRSAFADGAVVTVRESGDAHSGRSAARLSAEGENIGIDSRPIESGLDFDPGRRHLVAATISNRGIARGTFGLRFYCYDDAGKYLGMKTAGNLNERSPQEGWQRVEAVVGPGTPFPFPDKTHHVVVRFSFWNETNDCRGTVLVDDVFFGPVEGRQSPTRELARSEKGAIVVWKDEALTPASAPEHLAAVLASAGYGVTLLDRREMADRRLLRADRCDLVVLPYGPHYPVGPHDALAAYLRDGGALLTLGGPCLRDPVYAGPRSSSAVPAPRPIAAISPELLAGLKPSTASGEVPAKLSLVDGPGNEAALEAALPDLKQYQYLWFAAQGSPSCDVLHFQARGDSETTHLCLEMIATDGSRWKAVADLSPQWRAYDVPTFSFVAYATDARGGPGDYLRPGEVRRVAVGFPASLVGKGPRRFAIAELQWRSTGMAGERPLHPPLLFNAHADLRRAFGSELRLPPPGRVTLYHGAESFRSQSVHAAPGQAIVPGEFALSGLISGSTPTVLEDDLVLLRATESGRRAFLPSKRLVRTIPLLVTPDGEVAGALFLHVGGEYAGSRWASFGVTSPDLFPPQSPAAGAALAAIVDRVLHGPVLASLEPRFEVSGRKVRMVVDARVMNTYAAPQNVELRARLDTGGGSEPTTAGATTVKLAPGESRRIAVLEVDAEQLDSKEYRVACELAAADGRCDGLSTSVDVRGTLVAVCDRFVRTEAERADGKFSGVGFVDNRGARGLLAAYDITGDKRYLDAAIRWGEALIAEQRPDGGYLMGYGYHEDGNECFVADGGEIACGIARLASYAPESRRKQFLDSLQAYMGYRESFRCEGGGIGVGWCKTDYGKRPTVRLDQITKIFAPETNIYTIGCTLAAATMHAQLAGDAKDNDAAVRDARWLMARCDRTVTGAFVESFVWANKFLEGPGIKDETGQFLRKTFLPYVTPADSAWWRGGEGRHVQALDGLVYFYDCIEKDPEVLAALLRATWHVASPQSVCGLHGVLAQEKLNLSQWMYLNFAAVSLPDLVQSEIVRKPF